MQSSVKPDDPAERGQPVVEFTAGAHLTGDERREVQISCNHVYPAVGFPEELREAGATFEPCVSQSEKAFAWQALPDRL